MKRRILLGGAIAMMLCAGCISGEAKKDEETSSKAQSYATATEVDESTMEKTEAEKTEPEVTEPIGETEEVEETTSVPEEVLSTEEPTETAGLLAGFNEQLIKQLDPAQDEWLTECITSFQMTLEEAIEISEIRYGSFSAAEADEVLVLFRFQEEPVHVAGFDRVIAVVYDSETLTLQSQVTLEGDKVSVYLLPASDGRDKMFVLADTVGTGYMLSQHQTLYALESDEWVQQEDPLAQWREDIPYDNGTETSTYCFMTNGTDMGVCALTVSQAGEYGEETDLDLELKVMLSWHAYTDGFSEMETVK